MMPRSSYTLAALLLPSRIALSRAITEKESQNERLVGFIKILKAHGGIIAEFVERLWSSMVDFVTVGRNKEMAVTFRDGTEITA